MLISCNVHGGNFWIFSTSSQTNVLQDPTITCVQKCFLLKKIILVLETAILECFWWKHNKKLLGFNSNFKSVCEKNRKNKV